MANLNAAKRSRKQFKEIGSSAQGSVHILNESMDRKDSFYAIQRRNYETLTLQLAFSVFRESLIVESQRYFAKTGNIMRFHLEGNGPKEVGYYNIDESGNLQKGNGDADKNVYVYAIRSQQFLSVYPDTIGNIRFNLNASEGRNDISSVVVGFRRAAEQMDEDVAKTALRN